MVDASQFDINVLRNKSVQSFRIRLYGENGGNAEGYEITQDGSYHLRYVLNITCQLQNGTRISQGYGFLISKNLEDRPYEMGLAYYDFTGVSYSAIPQSSIEDIVVEYNNTVAGDEAETTETKERERTEPLEEEEEVDEEAERLRKQQTVLNEELVIREEELALSSDAGNLQRTTTLKIIQITRGTELNPIVTYRVVEEYQDRETFSQNANTQEEAENIFDEFVEQMNLEFSELAKESEEKIRLSTPLETRPYSKTEFYFVESQYNFKQMLEIGDPDFQQQPIFNRGLYDGNFGDAITFTNNGNTLNLDDFDIPRITTSGVQENKSAGVAFTVRQNWSMTFRLKGDSNIKMLKDSKVEGVKEVNSTTFDFTMYSGDNLQIDIDNERENIRPFLVQIKGQEWYSPIEIDDEVSLTLVKAERLSVKYESGFETIYPEGSPKPTEFDKEFDYEGPAYGENQSPYVEEAREKYPEYESANREITSPLPEAEASFTTVGEIVEPVTGAVGETVDAVGGAVGGAVDSFFSKYRWWIIGGLAVVGLTLFALYRIRNPKVAPTQPVVVAQAPPVQASEGSE